MYLYIDIDFEIVKKECQGHQASNRIITARFGRTRLIEFSLKIKLKQPLYKSESKNPEPIRRHADAKSKEGITEIATFECLLLSMYHSKLPTPATAFSEVH